jgi:tetratricopeptide (TPR) repeat protein
MRRLAILVLIGLASIGHACAPKAAPSTVAVAPKYPDFVRPAVPQDFAGTAEASHLDRGWSYLQAGDQRNAERELTAALRTTPTFYPADAASGYLELTRKNPSAALNRFDRALSRRDDYVSAVVGRGEALAALERDGEAAAAFERATSLDPSLTDLSRRAAVLRFRGLERDVAAARDAARAGRTDDAIRLYQVAIARAPESAFLYRELGVIERQKGDSEQALTHFRQALTLDPSDAAAHAQIAELLDARGDLAGALAAYNAALAIEPNPALESRREALRGRLAVARLPAEYRSIETAPQVTRADLAALIGNHLPALLQAGAAANTAVITDIRSHWAEPWILEVARAGVMLPFENHTFQPRTVVRRVDLAEAVNVLLQRLAAGRPMPYQNIRLRFTDFAPTHLSYPAVSAAVASGVLTQAPGTAFQPTRPVTGGEALDAIRRLETLASPSGRTTAGR